MDLANIDTNRILWIGNIEKSIREPDIKELCAPFGQIESINLPLHDDDENNFYHKGYCFVKFEEVDDAKQAKDNLHLSIVNNKCLTVNFKHAKKILINK